MRAKSRKGRRLGELEELILLSVCSLGDEAYAVRIQERLEEDVGRHVALGAVYTALDRMERKRYARSRLGEPTAIRGGRRKRFYLATAEGLDALNELRSARQRLWARVQVLPEAAGG